MNWNIIWVVEFASTSGRTKSITKRRNVLCDWFIPPLLLPTKTVWFSLDHKRNISYGVQSGVGRKRKRSDSSDSDSVGLLTPLVTPIFYFHQVISALTTPFTTPTPTLVKTILKTTLWLNKYLFSILPFKRISSKAKLSWLAVVSWPVNNKILKPY